MKRHLILRVERVMFLVVALALAALVISLFGCADPASPPPPSYARGCTYDVPILNPDGSVAVVLTVTELRPATCAEVAANRPGVVPL